MMKRILKNSALIACFAPAALIASPVSADDHDSVEAEGSAELAELLEGRVAGEPVSCINTRRNVRTTIIDRTALVFKSGSTYYVNTTRNPRWIDEDDTLVSRTITSRLCSVDTMDTIDRFSGVPTGTLFLGEFVPYREADG